MNISPTLYVSDIMDRIRAEICPDITKQQLLSAIIQLLLSETTLSLEQIRTMDSETLRRQIQSVGTTQVFE